MSAEGSPPVEGQSNARRWAFGARVAGGAAAGLLLAQATWDHPWIGFAGLAALAAVFVRARDARESFAIPWAGFGVAHAVAFPWVVNHPYPRIALAGALVVVLVPMLLAAAWSVGWRLARGRSAAVRVVAVVATTVVVEWLLYAGPVPLPWGLPGQLFSSWTLFDGIASRAGPTGLGAMITLAALAAASAPGGRAIPSIPGHPGRFRSPGRLQSLVGVRTARALVGLRTARALVGPVLAAWILFIAAAVPRPTAGEGPRFVRVALVQPGWEAVRWDRSTRRAEVLLALTDSLMASRGPLPDWIQWPESSLRTASDRDSAAAGARRWGRPLVSGAVVFGEDDHLYNSVLVLRESGTTSRYDKQRLVPFVEHVPFEEVLPPLGAAGLDSVRFRPGAGPVVVELAGVRVGFAVCFETLFPAHSRDLARAGADIVAALTNDGWWRSPRAPLLHATYSRGRALESGRPLVQASVSGFTGVTTPDGRRLEALPYGSAGATVVTVPIARPPDRFAGDWLHVPALSFLAALALLRARLKPRRRRTVDGPS